MDSTKINASFSLWLDFCRLFFFTVGRAGSYGQTGEATMNKGTAVGCVGNFFDIYF